MKLDRFAASRARFAAALGALSLGLAGAGCGPSIDPAAKADIDKRVSILRPGAATVPAGTGFVPMPLAAGQWSQYKMTDDKNEPSFITYKILGEEGGAHWVEIVHEGYTGKMIQKMLVAFGNRSDLNQVEIRALTMKDQKGNLNEIPPPALQLMQSAYRGAVSSLIVSWQGLPQESATVPAGQFEGCFKARTEAQWGPWKSTADTWAHPAVPISGTVRAQGVDKPFTMELVAYGTTGARSEM